MIGKEDAPFTYEYEEHYKILPQINNWNKDIHRIKDGEMVPANFIYSSETNDKWMSQKDLENWIQANHYKIGRI